MAIKSGAELVGEKNWKLHHDKQHKFFRIPEASLEMFSFHSLALTFYISDHDLMFIFSFYGNLETKNFLIGFMLGVVCLGQRILMIMHGKIACRLHENIK